jgi:hypothetical protein
MIPQSRVKGKTGWGDYARGGAYISALCLYDGGCEIWKYLGDLESFLRRFG